MDASGARAGWVAAIDVEVVGVVRPVGGSPPSRCGRCGRGPAYRTAAMDGIAAHAADTNTATPQRPARLSPAEFDLIDTGDLMPDGRDSVICALDDGAATGTPAPTPV